MENKALAKFLGRRRRFEEEINSLRMLYLQFNHLWAIHNLLLYNHGRFLNIRSINEKPGQIKML